MGKMSKILQNAISLVLIAALLSSVLSLGAFAAVNDYAGPSVKSVNMNITRSQFTLVFDREIESSVSNLRSKIKISQDGKTPVNLSSSAKVSVSGYNMLITLPTPLDTASNFFLIASGALVNQTVDLESPLFDARGPVLDPTNPITLNSSDKTVTIRFKTEIKGYPNDASLKNGYISLARNGTSFNEIIPEKDIRIDNSRGEITIYLDEWLTGSKSKFKIAAGKVKVSDTGNINIDDIITPAIKISDAGSSSNQSSSDSEFTGQLPEIDRTEISSDLKTVTIYFTSRIKNAFAVGTSTSLASSFLKSHIWISRTSNNNYELLSGADELYVGSNYIRITFNEALIKNRNYIKIEGKSLTDANGNSITEDIITDNITAEVPTSSSVPAYASASLLSNKKIAIYFSIPVIKNASLTTSGLRSSISISRNGSTYKQLTSYDSVSFSGNSMIINLDTPLSGTNNRVKIQANTVTSKLGTPLEKAVTTSALSCDDYEDDYYDSEPEYWKVTYDSSSKCINVYFRDDIKFTSSADILDGITISRNTTTFKSLSSYDVVRISPRNVLSILLDEPLSGTKNAVRIAGNILADYNTGYILNDTVTTEYFSADSVSEPAPPSSSGTSEYTGNVSAEISEDFYTVSLKFNEPLYNNFETLDELKEKIQISRNGSFSALTSDDYIRINDADNELVIVLATPANDYFSQIKILSKALRNASGEAISSVMATLPLGEADGEARIYINDSALDAPVSSQVSADSVIATFSDEADITSLNKSAEILVKLPDEKNSAILNISKNVVDSVKRYGGSFALSFGSATYYLPTSNIPALSDGDTLSLSIDKEADGAQSLASASTKDSFSIRTPAVKFSASIIASDGAKKNITHTAFAKKRFMVNGDLGTAHFTSVRVEKSGAISPVPSKAEEKAGVIYITSKTLSDGDYAAISAVHTFANTPNWVVTPANTLGSRLILSNKTGSDLNASQAISRAETVTIMAKTLGIFCDASGASPFFDMISTDTYFNAVMSAVSHKLISGYPDGTFKPNGTLTRAEAMTIVARAMRFMNGKPASASADMTEAEATSILSKFTDAASVDTWAKVDIAECVSAGVVNGDNKGRLNPKANVTRAELIQLMYNVLSKSDILS